MKRFFAKLFGFDRYEFDGVVLYSDAADDICSIASGAYPNEFFSFLKGKIVNKKLKIEGLLVQAYDASPNQTVYHLDGLPMISGVVGTAHSHPNSGGPSKADRESFSKTGFVHIIISKPYRKENIRMYDIKGKEIRFSII